MEELAIALSYQTQFIIAESIAAIALIVAVWAVSVSLRIKQRHFRFLGSNPPEGFEAWMVNIQEQVANVAQNSNAVDARLKQLDTKMGATLRQVGLVRFNPFDDTGSDLSFSLALLAESGDGVVLTSLWGRDEVRLYAKPVHQTKSTHPLSQEELRAIDMAMNARLPN